MTVRRYARYVEVMSVKTTKADKRSDPRYLAKLVKDGHAIDLEDAKHVAKLVERGAFTLGKPIPPELLTPGPKIPGVQAALRAARRSR